MYQSISEKHGAITGILCSFQFRELQDAIPSVHMLELGRETALASDCRLYDALASPDSEDHHITNQSHIMVLNAMTPTAGSEQAFNAWYTEEHIPLLRRVPGWLSSRRYKLRSSTSDQCHTYLAVHRYGDSSAFETQEYKVATNTAWREEVIGQVVNKERIVLRYQGELDGIVGEKPEVKDVA